MPLRTLIAAVFVAAATCAAVPGELPAPVSLEIGAATGAADELIARFGFAEMFASFGDSLAAGPRLSGISDARFLGAWEPSAHSAFADPALSARLSAALGAALSSREVAEIAAFLDSAAGRRIAALEAATQAAARADRIGQIASGHVLWLRMREDRRDRLAELLGLTGADISFDMLVDSMRGMAMGLRLASAGDLEIEWAEVDAEVDRRLAGMKASLADAARGVAALTYAGLSDDELDAYLAFLRRDSTRRFYGTAALAIGDIVRETMFSLGETVAERLRRVGV